MKFLVDSCIAPDVTDALRADGHDVDSVAEWPADPGDDEILATAERERRIVITFDRDYGTLIFRDERAHAGLVRLAAMDPDAQVSVCRHVIADAGDDLEKGAVVVANRTSLRIRVP